MFGGGGKAVKKSVFQSKVDKDGQDKSLTWYHADKHQTVATRFMQIKPVNKACCYLFCASLPCWMVNETYITETTTQSPESQVTGN